MGLADTLARIPKILESNINALLDKCEDPAKMIDQLLVDYRRDLADVRRDTAAVMADAKLAKQKVQDNANELAKVENACKNALVAGDEAAAAKLIERKQKLESVKVSLEQNLTIAEKNAQQMREAHDALVANIEDLEARKDAAKAKISIAKAQKGINAATARAKSTTASERFSKYEDRANKMLAEAEAEADLATQTDATDDLLEKYSSSAGSASVNAEMERMKRELGLM